MKLSLLSLAASASAVVSNASGTLLNQWPMIMAHNAGTCYSGDTCSLAHPMNNYVMTQSKGTFSSLLDCGARAIDLRPKEKDGQLIMHHGDIDIDHAVSDALGDINAWAQGNPDELVVIYQSHCEGSACASMFQDALKAAKIPHVECDGLKSLTVDAAMSLGGREGASVIAVSDCVEENYDEHIACYGGGIEEKFACIDSATRDKALAPLWTYMSDHCDTSEAPFVGRDRMWMVQAHWQSNGASVARGELRKSCVLEDESKAGVNQQLATKIRDGAFKHINFLEVDNVCDGGRDLFDALRSRSEAGAMLI